MCNVDIGIGAGDECLGAGTMDVICLGSGMVPCGAFPGEVCVVS